MKKSVKILGMLFALMALVFVGCSDGSDSDDNPSDTLDISTRLLNPNGSYKVETGKISFDDLTTFQNWKNGTYASDFETQQEYLTEFQNEKNDLKSKSVNNSYNNKGTMTAAALKNWLLEISTVSADKNESVNSAINIAELYGCELIGTQADNTNQTVTWVYIEK